ncbi:MAG: hypothetical protein JNM17_16220 [Archangium sp.]|nr:hypothetical protein [Archangium sp.]
MAREVSASAATLPATWGPWLFGPGRDLAILLVPIFVLLSFVAFSQTSASFAEDSNRYAMWLATNVLGNGTHVVLTFLLFALRPETMRSTPTLRAQVYLGIFVTLAVSSGFFALHRWEPQAAIYARAVVFALFGTHHTLSQNRGYWSLYVARERSAGLKPSDREGQLQRMMVPLTLGLLLTRYFFVAASNENDMPFVDLGTPALLPFKFIGVLLLVWLAFWAVVFRAVLPNGTQRPKLLYLLAVALAGSVSLLAPTWGLVLFFGMHGLEYYFLSERMLTQLPDDKKQVAQRWIWPLMVLSMAPLIAMGVVTLMRDETSSEALQSFTKSGFWQLAVTLSTACVLAHYWADALIYRFRLPDVRKIMLARIRL